MARSPQTCTCTLCSRLLTPGVKNGLGRRPRAERAAPYRCTITSVAGQPKQSRLQTFLLILFAPGAYE